MTSEEKSAITQAVNKLMNEKIRSIAGCTNYKMTGDDWGRELRRALSDIYSSQEALEDLKKEIKTVNSEIDETIAKSEEIQKAVNSPIVTNTIAFTTHLKEMGCDLSDGHISLMVQAMINGLSYEAWKQKQVEGWGRNKE
jgi:hypothetical protein